MPNISTKICGIELENPTVLVSGILDNTGELMARAARSGAAAVTTKSISPKPRKGYENPTIADLGDLGILNSMGLPNPGIEEFTGELKIFRKLNSKNNTTAVLIGSCFGETIDEFASAALQISEYADIIELNLSCPHSHLVAVGQDAKLVREIVKSTKAVLDKHKPLIVKLTPNVSKIEEIADAAVDAGADGIAAINTVKAMSVNAYMRSPILANITGGYSGPAIKPIALRCVYDIAKTVQDRDVSIIGIGGITGGIDAVEMMMAGADAVGIGTAVKFSGVEIFRKICTEIEEFMIEENYKNLSEIIGCAVK